VAAAAYLSGQKLYNEYDGRTYNYAQKTGIYYSEILLPANAPRRFLDRQALWNAVEKSERRVNSRTAREIVLALPREFTFPEQKAVAIKYILDTFVSQGMCADVAIHVSRHSYNPHLHVLLTTREVGPEGFGMKNRDWDKKEYLNLWREQWANALNREFILRGLDVRVAYKSYSRRDMTREPALHLGPVLSAMERRGIKTRRGDVNRGIEARNRERTEQEHQRQQELEYDRDR